MELYFPSYLNRKPESVKGTGNAVIPEGTRVTWKIDTETTENLSGYGELNFAFQRDENVFTLSKNISQIQIIKLLHRIIGLKTMKIKLPTVGGKGSVSFYPGEPSPDSLKLAKNFVLGKVSDDYGLLNYIRGISGNYPGENNSY
jgi:hypothetical protein